MAVRQPLPVPLAAGAEIIFALNPMAPAFVRNRFATRARVIAAGGTWARDNALFARVWSEVKANRNPMLDDAPYYRVRGATVLGAVGRARGDLYVIKLAFVQRNVDTNGDPISDVYTHEHEYTSSKPTSVRAATADWLARIDEATDNGSRWQVLAVIPRRLLWPVRTRAAAVTFVNKYRKA